MDNQCLICFVGETILLSSKMIATSIFYYCILIVKMKKKIRRKLLAPPFSMNLWNIVSNYENQAVDENSRVIEGNLENLLLTWVYVGPICTTSASQVFLFPLPTSIMDPL